MQPISPLLQQVMAQEAVSTALENAGAFGQWWCEAETAQIVLSVAATRFLSLDTQHHDQLDECFIHVVGDDMLVLILMLSQPRHEPISHEFRVISAVEGLRWLRITSLPLDPMHPRIMSGILTDITPIKHAFMRERLGFELTQYLVGSHRLDNTIINVIQLICNTLGWEWGAYWALEQSPERESQLVCKHQWHHPEHEITSFGNASSALMMRPGEGLVGEVWATGEASWVEDMANDPRFLRRASARECRLWSGYVFPVTYVSDDGEQHRPGVLEFYSSLSRQPDAQLPSLSTTIGALIAQTAQQLEHQAAIIHLAQVDELTSLLNRSRFYELLTKACTQAAKVKSTFGLLFIDLDRFKPINDAYGHDAGNVVLREFALRLQTLAPPGASVGRLGGDEFALLLPRESTLDLAGLAEQVLQAARRPFTYEGIELNLSASIGISTFPENGKTIPELLRSADEAMYRIKKNGRNGCDFFSDSNPSVLAHQQSTLAQRLTIESELHHALQINALFLVYQPIFDISAKRLHAIEALIRWRRSDGTIVQPNVFIPIAEQSHLIGDIGKWVITQACIDLAILHRANFSGLKVHVNMAASEFSDSSLPKTLGALLATCHLEPHSLSLELTEGMLMKQPHQVIPVMHALRELGFEISLDDFGLGHSSLSMLKNLPISSMKIDHSFVCDLAHQGRDRAIVQTIVDLGQHMGLSVIAEGVETVSQLEILSQSGCNLIQGFLLSRPLGLPDLLARFPGGTWLP